MKKLKDNVYWVGANDWEIRAFHGNEISIDRGTSYNAYLIKDEKNVLIDTVSQFSTDTLLGRISKVMDVRELDYIVINHAEPDHSGSLATLMELCPNAQIISSVKGEESIKKTLRLVT